MPRTLFLQTDGNLVLLAMLKIKNILKKKLKTSIHMVGLDTSIVGMKQKGVLRDMKLATSLGKQSIIIRSQE
ncbi:hypothetical protein [Pedobacter hiemivivus]|uniref:Uncharacterized protein n=1 Tax=Pedobacter hiemivivus TaxID=2530454 RepID=A0A4R0NB86_9SPHI|nr:hypothetical protein [Pedobacter hiemivivus]TCC97559.1 hypothetical protein EZ444_06475 [Pedobacter hiemivivus]